MTKKIQKALFTQQIKSKTFVVDKILVNQKKTYRLKPVAQGLNINLTRLQNYFHIDLDGNKIMSIPS